MTLLFANIRKLQILRERSEFIDRGGGPGAILKNMWYKMDGPPLETRYKMDPSLKVYNIWGVGEKTSGFFTGKNHILLKKTAKIYGTKWMPIESRYKMDGPPPEFPPSPHCR